MKIYEFLSLDDTSQYNTVWEQGRHLDDIIIDKIHYQLYSINDFFVEVHYDAADNKIIGKQAFKQDNHINKYLKNYNINKAPEGLHLLSTVSFSI